MSTEPVHKIFLNHQSAILNKYTLLPSLLFLVILTIKPASARGAQSPVVRLLLGENLPQAIVSGNSLQVEKQVNKNWKPVITRTRLAGFRSVPDGVQLDGSDVVASVFRVLPGEGMIKYANRSYRGFLTIRVNSGRLMVVSSMPLESYLAGVVNGEVDSSWPLDAVKAQVVAARSYALYQLNARSPYYDLKTDITDQVYAGVDSEDERAVKAVEKTRGQVLYMEGNLIQAFFHSSCGGNTSSAAEVWGVRQPAQEGVYCGECGEAPYASWSLAPDSGELIRAIMNLCPGVESIRSIGIHKRSRDGRIQTLFAETGKGRVLIDAGEFRREIGYRRLRSTMFSLGRSGDKIILMGKGYGHGVGLCQWGARGSALKGMDYMQILAKYYPGTEVRRAY